jgi:hypothetical protein
MSGFDQLWKRSVCRTRAVNFRIVPLHLWMPDDYLRSIEPLIAIVLDRVCRSGPPLSLPSLGVSSLDLGRLWQRRRPFFFVYAVAPAAIPRRHRFQSTTRPSCLLPPHRQSKGKTTWPRPLSGDLQRQDRWHPQRGRVYTHAVVVQDDALSVLR